MRAILRITLAGVAQTIVVSHMHLLGQLAVRQNVWMHALSRRMSKHEMENYRYELLVAAQRTAAAGRRSEKRFQSKKTLQAVELAGQIIKYIFLSDKASVRYLSGGFFFAFSTMVSASSGSKNPPSIAVCDANFTART